MNILVTGGCGYVGSNLCNHLVKSGHHVTSMDCLIDQPFYLDENIDIKQKNILDITKNDLKNYDHIFHLAALPRIGASFDDPVAYFLNNSHGTAVLLNALVGLKTTFTFISSSSCYSCDELNPYSCSKIMAESVCRLYQKSFGINLSITRLFNVYGNNHLRNGKKACMMGLFENAILKNDIIRVYGSGEQRRDFTHINDICSGLKQLMGFNIDGLVDLGFGENYSVNEIIAMLGGEKIEFISCRDGEGNNTLANVNKTNDYIKWNPEIKISEYIMEFLSKKNKGS